MKLLIATRNKGKFREFQELFEGSGYTLMSLDDFSVVDVEETGSTFEENAILKARGYALQTGELTLADDSGLEVEALDYAPGVYSARYAGINSSDEENNEKLLVELSRKKKSGRKARFVCVIAISNPEGKVLEKAKGICHGTIAEKISGQNGFGYDSLFIPIGEVRTLGFHKPNEKNEISHRSKAIRKILDKIVIRT